MMTLNLTERSVHRVSEMMEIESYTNDFHRWCYQQFTNVTYLKRKLIIEESQRAESSEQPASKCQRRSLSHSSQSALFPSDKCIFCNKESLKYKGEKQKLTKCVTKTAEEVIKRCAEKRGDYDILSKVRDVDLVAREAMYHPMCRRIYTRPDGRNTSKIR